MLREGHAKCDTTLHLSALEQRKPEPRFALLAPRAPLPPSLKSAAVVNDDESPVDGRTPVLLNTLDSSGVSVRLRSETESESR